MSRQAVRRPEFLPRPSASSSGCSLSCITFSAMTRSLRPLLVRSGAFAAAMALRLAGLAEIRIRANEHPPALVVGDDLVEVRVIGAAQRAGRVMTVAVERMVLEIERHHRRVGRDRVDALFTAGAKQLQLRGIVLLWG